MSNTSRKRPLDDAYEQLKNSLQPVNVREMPGRKSLKTVYGPIRPVPERDIYLDNLQNSDLLSKQAKRKRHSRYVLSDKFLIKGSPTKKSPTKGSPTKRGSPTKQGSPKKGIRFGTTQTVRIPKKNTAYKNAALAMKLHNRAIKRSYHPDMEDSPTHLLQTDVSSDIEEDTDATIYSPTINEEPIPELPPFYTLHIYLQDDTNKYIRMLPHEQQIDSSMTLEDLMVFVDNIAEDNGFRDVNVSIGQMVSQNQFNPFKVSFFNLSHKLFSMDNMLPNKIVDAVVKLR